MALKNAEGHYAKFDTINTETQRARMKIYPSENGRRNGLGPFQAPRDEGVSLGDLLPAELDKPADPDKSIRDNLTTAAYNAAKQMGKWADWTDA